MKLNNKRTILVGFAFLSICAFCSFLTMGFVRHGDNKVEAKQSPEAFDVED